MIKFNCGECGQKIGVKDEADGRKIRCPKCNHVNEVPLKSSSKEIPPVDELNARNKMDPRIIESSFGKETIAYHCPNCGVDLESPFKDAGKGDICPACNKSFIVPGKEIPDARKTNKINRQDSSPPKSDTQLDFGHLKTVPVWKCNACGWFSKSKADFCSKCKSEMETALVHRRFCWERVIFINIMVIATSLVWPQFWHICPCVYLFAFLLKTKYDMLKPDSFLPCGVMYEYFIKPKPDSWVFRQFSLRRFGMEFIYFPALAILEVFWFTMMVFTFGGI